MFSQQEDIYLLETKGITNVSNRKLDDTLNV